MALDTQQIEVIGKGWLISDLVRAGFEVATLVRDNGVDLLVSAPDYGWTQPRTSKACCLRFDRAEHSLVGQVARARNPPRWRTMRPPHQPSSGFRLLSGLVNHASRPRR